MKKLILLEKIGYILTLLLDNNINTLYIVST